MPTVSEIVKMYGLSARRQLSQNFILDMNLATKIVSSIPGDLTKKTVIEVGSGPGSLTRSLLINGAKKVIAIEKDKRFIPALEILQQASNGRLQLHFDDMLKIDENQLLQPHQKKKATWEEERPPVVIIGNLPFNVGTQLLLKWLKQIPERKGPFSYGRVPLILLYQKEVAERIVAKTGDTDFSRLSVMVQHCCEANLLFNIPGSAFVPPPDITASLVEVQPSVKPIATVNILSLEYVLREVFGQRRKMVSNSIKKLGPELGKRILQETNLNPSLRPQQLSIAEWCQIANAWDLLKSEFPDTQIKKTDKEDDYL